MSTMIGNKIPATKILANDKRSRLPDAPRGNPRKVIPCPHCTICPQCEAALKFGLTRQELTIVRLLCEGLSNAELGAELNISEETVKRHMTNVFDKTGMDSRLSLAMKAVRSGWFTGLPPALPAYHAVPLDEAPSLADLGEEVCA
jgi:DNA-binding NarL/FixJ family response regulator